MDLTRQDVDQLIKQFQSSPDSDTYNSIHSWYESSVNSFPDQEYLVCVYLFLLGANIKHRYSALSYEQHMAQIKEIKQIIDSGDRLSKLQRKAYLDYGSKSA